MLKAHPTFNAHTLHLPQEPVQPQLAARRAAPEARVRDDGLRASANYNLHMEQGWVGRSESSEAEAA